MTGNFSQLKVIEIASVLAGPSVGMFFAEHGARVIKIENKLTKGDVTRSWKLPTEPKDATVSAYFSSVNWNKEYVFLDLSRSTDRREVLNLIRDADILIANFKHGDAEKFELDYAQIKRINPRIIYGEINGFGTESDRVAYDLILQAETGFMSMNGTPTSGPVKMPVALIDIMAGHQLKEGILTALYTQTFGLKKSFHLSVSLYDTAIASLANQATNYLMAHHVPQRIGSTHPNIAPYGELFETKDATLVTFAVGSDRQFEKLCALINAAGLVDDEKFKNNSNRVKNRELLSTTLQPLIAHFNAEELISRCHAAFVPVAKIKALDQVFEEDAARALILKEEIEGTLTQRVKTSIYKELD